jgi:hypothetical protein
MVEIEALVRLPTLVGMLPWEVPQQQVQEVWLTKRKSMIPGTLLGLKLSSPVRLQLKTRPQREAL